MTCTFSKEFTNSSKTNLENSFISDYLPTSNGDAVRVYLYGLYLCQNPEADLPLPEIAKTLGLTEEQVVDAFLYWQEFDLVSVTENPFSVRYLPVLRDGYRKPKKFSPEKYGEFCSVLQSKFPDRAVAINEYSEYFTIMEVYSIREDAMLMIVDHCIERKGKDVGYRYISKVAKDFGNRGLNTVEKVENELKKYVSRTAEIQKILSAMGSTKAPELEHLNYLNKWTNELGFSEESILYSAKVLKKGSFEKLDAFMMELFGLKCFSVEEIEQYAEKKKKLFSTSLKITKALSLYFEVIDTVVDNYTSKWFDMGYQEDSLLFLATYCFRQGKNSLDNMDNLISFLYKNGLITVSALTEYFLNIENEEQFIQEVLSDLGIRRRPTNWDLNNLRQWREWNFSDDMIREAARKSVGKSSPIPYMNAVLGGWKSKGIFDKESLEKEDSVQKPVSGVKKSVTVEKISAKYEQRRYEANERAIKNKKTAESVDGFHDLFASASAFDVDIALAEFEKRADDAVNLTNKKKETVEKINELLKPVSLSFEDLKPKYRCKDCNDTGFNGEKRCHCYDEVFRECEEEL